MSSDGLTERALADELLDVLAGEIQPEAALLAALDFLLNTASRAAGVLFVFSPGNSFSPSSAISPGTAELAWRVETRLSDDWTQQLADPLSPLCRLAAANLAAGSLAAAQAGDPEPRLPGCAAVLPIFGRAQRVGLLIVQGPPLDPALLERMDDLTHCLGRAVLRNWDAWTSLLPAQEAAALERIAAALSSSLDLDDILTSAVEAIGDILDVEAVSLLLRDDQEGSLLFKKRLDGGRDWLIQRRTGEVTTGLVGACLAERQMIAVERGLSDPRYLPDLDGQAGLSVRGLLLAPLLAHGHCAGVISLLNKRHGRFSARDRGLLRTMSASLANAVNNARLYHKATAANAALEANRGEILRSRNTLRSLFDGISGPIYIVDRECRLVAVNRACAGLTGRQPQALVGRFCPSALGRHSNACLACPVMPTFHTGASGHAQLHRPARPGVSASDWEVNTYPIQDGAGVTTQVIVFEQDVTEQRRLEGLLAQADKLAAMGQLAASIVHEIGNPLTAVQLNAQLLQRSLPAGCDDRESADLIAMAVDRAMTTVRGLLDFSRPDNQLFGPVDVNATLCQAAGLTASQLRGEGIDLVYDLSEALPPVIGSRDHLQSVWLNLILNASQAIHNSHREIRVSSRQLEGWVEVCVADTGDGISPEHLPHVFEPFFSTKAPGQGTGLGLSVCQRIIRQHGGEIRVDSVVDQGTRIIVRLPLTQ